jgi:hypothetical protein
MRPLLMLMGLDGSASLVQHRGQQEVKHHPSSKKNSSWVKRLCALIKLKPPGTTI